MKQADPPIVPEALLPVVLGASVVIELLISAVAIALGLALGPRVGLGLMFVPEPSAYEPSGWRRLWTAVGQPLAIGVAMGVIMAFLPERWIFPSGAKHPNLTMPPAGEGLLASVGAGIREEIWLRLGFMTLLVWLGAITIRAFTKREPEAPKLAALHPEFASEYVPFTKREWEIPASIVWVGNLLAALLFAAVHIPQASALLGLTGPLLVFILVGNGVPGLVFGWLYWRRGLYAAMLAHFGLDLVLKVFVPLLS
jgi:hypothetical protein